MCGDHHTPWLYPSRAFQHSVCVFVCVWRSKWQRWKRLIAQTQYLLNYQLSFWHHSISQKSTLAFCYIRFAFFSYLLNFDISNIYNKFCFFVHSPIVVRQTIIDNKNFIVLMAILWAGCFNIQTVEKCFTTQINGYSIVLMCMCLATLNMPHHLCINEVTPENYHDRKKKILNAHLVIVFRHLQNRNQKQNRKEQETLFQKPI